VGKLLVLDFVSATREDVQRCMPSVLEVARRGFMAELEPILPAVTCPVQASMLTGVPPRDHGIVGNGWYFRDLAEVWLWRQSNALVQAPKVWDRVRAKGRDLKVAKLFWWYNMYSTATWSVTPRPHYTCDGRKFPGIYTQPPSLEKELESTLGTFPLFRFWGPEAGLESTRWIVECSLHVLGRFQPDLLLVYLPHADYDLQRFGPGSPQAREALSALDREAGRLIEAAFDRKYEVLIVTEYAMSKVSGAVPINRVLREAGLLAVRESLGWELLDFGASRAFAVADHQVAHVYVREKRDLDIVAEFLSSIEGIERVLGEEGKREAGLDHPRSGELVALSAPDRWFCYYWWLDPSRAPDFARTVDIHRKPGYDPLELFYDGSMRFPRFRVAAKALLNKLRFRVLFNVIGFETQRIKGSHGVIPSAGPLPVVAGSFPVEPRPRYGACRIASLIESALETGP